jgi:hypothetical protein
MNCGVISAATGEPLLILKNFQSGRGSVPVSFSAGTSGKTAGT